ncbi:MAG: carboxylesterase family protein [Paludibacteraceae bacterium]|nr:carboxylesterase family protein [Paludibacteraceae bacterium]
MKKIRFALGAMLLLLPAVSCRRAAEFPQVVTLDGTVEGFRRDGIEVYLGVPFAQPPVGELRWREPLPVVPYDTVLQAKQFGPDPMQYNVYGDMNLRGPVRSEDCLYLNIWAPERKMGGKRAVLIYFNGGGWVAGSGSEPRYDGASLARKGIIVVTANYREGVFGSLAHSALTDRSEVASSGNQGLLDQAAAIQWVYNNIEAFGGDSHRITIAGESAGSFSCSLLMTSPRVIPYLAGCIGSSGAMFMSRLRTLQQAEAQTEALWAERGWDVEQLLALPADSLMALYPTGDKSPVIDGYLLFESPKEAFAAGRQAQIPLLAGWNLNEGDPRWYLHGEPATLDLYRQAGTIQELGGRAGEVLEAYGIRTDADVLSRGAVDLCSDLFTGYPTWKWCEAQRAAGQPVYRYKFLPARPAMAQEGLQAGLAGGVRPADDAAVPEPEIPEGAVHSADIEYAMGNLSTNTVYAWRDADETLSELFQQYYVHFVKTGNPNGDSLPEWPILDETAPVMQLDFTPRVERNPDLEARYRLLDEIIAPR